MKSAAFAPVIEKMMPFRSSAAVPALLMVNACTVDVALLACTSPKSVPSLEAGVRSLFAIACPATCSAIDESTDKRQQT